MDLKIQQGEEYFYYYVVGRALAEKDFLTEARSAVEQITQKYGPKLSAPMANSIALSAAAESDLVYNEVSIKNYLMNYQADPTSKLYLSNVWSAGVLLHGKEMMSNHEIQQLFSKIFSDKSITIGDKLKAEADAFEAGLL